jgi:hypothetical protein
MGCCSLTIFKAREKDFDVVLIDTAGRMQDNEVRLCLLLCCYWQLSCFFGYWDIATHARSCEGESLVVIFVKASFDNFS